MKNPEKPKVIPVGEELPVKERRVIVICRGFRCLGYMDREGKWRDDARQMELTEVIGWIQAP